MSVMGLFEFRAMVIAAAEQVRKVVGTLDEQRWDKN